MADEAPADDLRSLLSQAHDSATKVEDTAVTPEPEVVAEPSEPETPIKAVDDDRPRDASGKFKKKDDAEPDDKASDKTDDKAVGVLADEQAPKQAETKPDGKSAPANWAASDKQMFDLMPPEAQDFLLRRHKSMEADYTKKVAAIADLKKEYEPVQQMFAPHTDVLRQKGLTPQSVIQRWADVETRLANGQGIDIIDGLVKGYQIDKGALARRLGFTSTPAAPQSIDEQGQVDPNAARQFSLHDIPELKALAEQVAQLNQAQQLQAQQAEQHRLSTMRASEEKVENEITSFKSAQDDKGNLLHPYFDEVEPAMIALAQSYQASKQPLPQLAELYETAVWANPSTRQAMLAAQKQAEQAKQLEEARAKSRQAQRLSSSVTGSPGTGQTTRDIRGDLSLREQLEEAFGDNA